MLNAVKIAKSGIFRTFVAVLEAAGVPYCILAGYERYPDEISSDVDFMVLPADEPRIPRLLERVARDAGCRLVQALRHETTACYYVLARLDGTDVVFLHPDSSTDYRRDGRIWLHAADILARRMRHPGGFFVASPADSFCYYLIKKVGKGALSPEQGRFLAERHQEDPCACRRELARRLPEASVGLVETALARGDWRLLESAMPALAHDLCRTAPRVPIWRSVALAAQEALRLADRLARPTGFAVAFLGPDGVGKSSVISEVQRVLAPAFRRTARHHLRPRLLPGASAPGPVTDPYAGAPRGLLPSALKLAYLVCDYAAGIAWRIFPQLVRSTFVAFDRYYPDLWADPARYRLGGPRWLIRAAGLLVPRLDLYIVLDASPEVLLARKQEIGFEQAVRLREAYRELAGRLPGAVLVDASGPLDQVAAQAACHILQALEIRAAGRLGVAR